MSFMGFYPEKPIRIDYFPKTKEDINKPEEPKIEDNLDRELDCKTIDEKEFVMEEITGCDDCIVKDVEVMENDIEEVMEDMEKVMEEMMEDKEDKKED